MEQGGPDGALAPHSGGRGNRGPGYYQGGLGGSLGGPVRLQSNPLPAGEYQAATYPFVSPIQLPIPSALALPRVVYLSDCRDTVYLAYAWLLDEGLLIPNAPHTGGWPHFLYSAVSSTTASDVPPADPYGSRPRISPRFSSILTNSSAHRRRFS